MKATGIVRRIDDLGRVVIPKEIRRTREIRLKYIRMRMARLFSKSIPRSGSFPPLLASMRRSFPAAQIFPFSSATGTM